MTSHSRDSVESYQLGTRAVLSDERRYFGPSALARRLRIDKQLSTGKVRDVGGVSGVSDRIRIDC
jgi:hypothetical protein